MKQMIFAPGVHAGKAVSLAEHFAYLATVEGSSTEAEIYANVAWVFRCLNIRADAISSLPWEVRRGETVTKWTIPLRSLLWKTEAALLLSGAAYWLKRLTSKEVKSLQWLNPNDTKAIYDSKGIKRFEQTIEGKVTKYPVEDIVYFRSWNPDDDLGPGVAPASVALEAAGLAKSANTWASSFFEHGAIPGVILTSEGYVDEAERERVTKAWNKFQAGVNKFKTAVLGQGLKAEVVGDGAKDVAMPELMKTAREQIAVAMGVPQTLVGDPAANYATKEQDRKSLYVETIIPESLLIEEVLNEQLFSQLSRPLVFGFLPHNLEVMQEEEKDRSEALLRLVMAGMPLETAIAVLGIDVPEGMSIRPTAVPGAVPASQLRDWSGDLSKWQSKALRHLKETKSAACDFESDAIPSTVGYALKARLDAATTPGEVKAAFAATFQNEAEMGRIG